MNIDNYTLDDMEEVQKTVLKIEKEKKKLVILMKNK